MRVLRATSSWLVSPDCNTEDMFDDSFPEDLRPKVAAPLETLSVDSIPVDYDLNPKLSRLINDYRTDRISIGLK